MTIEEMHLAPVAEAKARALQAAHPQVIFTSGRRTLEEQARAMAYNVVLAGQYWIRDTYSPSPTIEALQRAINRLPRELRTNLDKVEAALAQEMRQMTPQHLSSISRHLTGYAFDVKPHSCPLEALQALHPEKLLTEEGNLSRWHVQFKLP